MKANLGVFAFGLMALAGLAEAHTNFVENPVDGSRNFTENRRYFLKLNLAHTCGHGGVNYDIIHSGAVFPNAADAEITRYGAMTAAGSPDTNSEVTPLADLSEVIKTYDMQGNEHGANAMMSIKPINNANWQQIILNKDTVPAYYNHGVNTRDVRSIYWLNNKSPISGHYGGGFSNDYADSMEFVTTLGKLQGCVAKVRVFVPTIDACADGNMYVWTRRNTPVLSEQLINSSNGKLGLSTNYSAYIDIVRDNMKNPLPANCGGGQMVTIEPSQADIDKYLGSHAPSWISGGQGSGAQQCPVGQHWMNGACMDNSAM